MLVKFRLVFIAFGYTFILMDNHCFSLPFFKEIKNCLIQCLFKFQIKIEEQKRSIQDLESVVNRLAKSKNKIDRKLAEKSSVLQSTEKQTKEELLKTTKNYQQIEKELQITKEALEEAQNREKQVGFNL